MPSLGDPLIISFIIVNAQQRMDSLRKGDLWAFDVRLSLPHPHTHYSKDVSSSRLSYDVLRRKQRLISRTSLFLGDTFFSRVEFPS